MSHITLRTTDRNDQMIKYLIENGGYSNKSEVLRDSLAVMFIFQKHYPDVYDAILKVAEEKDMVELKVGNKYNNHERKPEDS